MKGIALITLLIASSFAAPFLQQQLNVDKHPLADEMVVDVAFHDARSCNGAIVQEMAGNVCVPVPWTYRDRTSVLVGNSFMTALTRLNPDNNIYDLQGRGFTATDCSGTANLLLDYSANVTEGCFNDGMDYELFFDGAETQSHRVTSFFPVVVYHQAPNCNGATLAVATPECAAVQWVLIRDGITYTGGSIDVDYYMHSTDINYYADTACTGNPLYRIVSQLVGNNCVAPDVYELFINGVKSFTYTVDQ